MQDLLGRGLLLALCCLHQLECKQQPQSSLLRAILQVITGSAPLCEGCCDYSFDASLNLMLAVLKQSSVSNDVRFSRMPSHLA